MKTFLGILIPFLGTTLGASVLLIVLCLMLLLSERKRRPHPLSTFLKPSNENEKP